MHSVRQIEFHVVHTCNLSCDGCQHYTNHNLGGLVPFEEGSRWLQQWGRRVQPKRFKLLGGEPLLNKDLPRYVRCAAGVWPDADRMVTTNGLLLERCPGLADALLETETRVMVSRHSNDPAYVDKFMAALDVLRRWGVEWTADDATKYWYRTYQGDGAGIRPFTDGDPRASWGACACRNCMQIHEGALWKCPPVAYLKPYVKKFPGVDRKAWAPFIGYQPLGIDATDEQLHEFVTRDTEPMCGLCPARPAYYEKAI